jgi:hypothetical protein
MLALSARTYLAAKAERQRREPHAALLLAACSLPSHVSGSAIRRLRDAVPQQPRIECVQIDQNPLAKADNRDAQSIAGDLVTAS